MPRQPAFLVEAFALTPGEPLSEAALDALSEAMVRRRTPAHRRPTSPRTTWLLAAVIAVLLTIAVLIVTVVLLTGMALLPQ